MLLINENIKLFVQAMWVTDYSTLSTTTVHLYNSPNKGSLSYYE